MYLLDIFLTRHTVIYPFPKILKMGFLLAGHPFRNVTAWNTRFVKRGLAATSFGFTGGRNPLGYLLKTSFTQIF